MRNIIKFSVLIIMLAGIHYPVDAQECGPGCPACSGTISGSLLPSKSVMSKVLFIPDGDEETAVISVMAGIFSWLNIGGGYAVDAEEIIWSVRVQAVAEQEDGWRPALVLGSGSVQTGGSDQSVYTQLIKNWEIMEGLAVSVSGGYATDIPDFEENYGLANVAITIRERISPFYIYDGRNSHVGITCFPTEWLILTGYYLEMAEPAISVGLKW